MSVMSVGQVKLFDAKKEFGLIMLCDRAIDEFVQCSVINAGSGHKTLREEIEVEFDLAEGEKGLQALSVVVLP